MKKANKTTKPKQTPRPRKSGEIGVSYAALTETEQSLKHEITSVRVGIRSTEKNLSAEIGRVDSKVDKLDAKVDKLDAKVEQVLAAVHRVAALVEEQNSRNRFVLDGYVSLHDAHEEIKARLDEVEKKGL